MTSLPDSAVEASDLYGEFGKSCHVLISIAYATDPCLCLPWCVASVSEGHVSGAQFVQHPQNSHARSNGVARLDADQTRDLTSGEGRLDKNSKTFITFSACFKQEGLETFLTFSFYFKEGQEK